MSTSRPPRPGWFERALEDRPDELRHVVDGRELAYLRWGEKTRPALVLVHGGAAHAHWWDHLAPSLATDHLVLAPDLSGHGESDWRERYPREDWAAELAGLLDHEGVEQAVLVGHSMGAAVAVTTLALFPERFTAGVLVDWGLRPPLEDRALRFGTNLVHRHRPLGRAPDYPSLEAGVERFRLIPGQPRVLDFVLEHVARQSLREVASAEEPRWRWKFDARVMLRQSRSTSRSDLGRCHRPMALIRGERSRVLTARLARYTLGRIRARGLGPVPMEVIPEAYHHLILDHPEEFLGGLRRCLTALGH